MFGAPPLAVGTCVDSMSTRPDASPKILVHASLMSGLVFILYSLGLRVTPSSARTLANDA